MKTKIFLSIAVLALFTFFSCSREQGLDQPGVDLADDDAFSDAVFEDIFNSVDNADIILDNFQKGSDAKSQLVSDTCPLVIIDRPSDAIWPKSVTIDYGSGCTGFFENTRSGRIIILVTGPRLLPGSKKSVTFDNYFFNGIKVEGTKEIENIGFNDNQNLMISVKLTGGKLTLPDGKVIERSFERMKEWTAGLLTRNIWDDECLITGVATGININGVAYTKTIIAPLHWTRACRFIVSGVVKIEREGYEPVYIDYGTGECDAVATVRIGDESKEITLKFRHRLMKP